MRSSSRNGRLAQITLWITAGERNQHAARGAHDSGMLHNSGRRATNVEVWNAEFNSAESSLGWSSHPRSFVFLTFHQVSVPLLATLCHKSTSSRRAESWLEHKIWSDRLSTYCAIFSSSILVWVSHLSRLNRIVVFLFRMIALQKILKDKEALKMMLPGFVRNLGWFGVMMGKRSVRKTAEKYKTTPGKLWSKIISPCLFLEQLSCLRWSNTECNAIVCHWTVKVPERWTCLI